MATNTGKYYVKNSASGTFQDVSTKFDGVHVLSVENIGSKGKAINVYMQQWMSGETDFMITGSTGKIIRENVDIKLVFICGDRYASSLTFDAETAKDEFVDFMTETDVWIRSTYYGKDVHCVCVDKVEPKTVKLKRGNNTYILGEITLKCLEKPTSIPNVQAGNAGNAV